MPGDLTTHIITASAQKGRDCTLLSDKPAAALLHALSKKFDFNYQQRWIWENLQPVIVKKYDQSPAVWRAAVFSFLEKFDRRLYLVATDEEYYPWPVFHCANTMLLPLLTDLRFFEYFVFDESMNCVLFDTHHNELLFCCL
jgi:hypothetical protein